MAAASVETLLDASVRFARPAPVIRRPPVTMGWLCEMTPSERKVRELTGAVNVVAPTMPTTESMEIPASWR
jgi:hypothetical protein